MPNHIINVNRFNIQRNKKGRHNLPVITVYNGESESHHHQVVIYGQDGKEAARIKYNPKEPIRGDTRVWIETDNKIETF